MIILFLILIIVCAVVLALIILVQNPKGGGLQGNVAGFSNQFMGVKQTTDILEKGTWIFVGLIATLCLFSRLFFSAPTSNNNLDRNFTTPTQQNTPAPAAPAAPANPADTNR